MIYINYKKVNKTLLDPIKYILVPRCTELKKNKLFFLKKVMTTKHAFQSKNNI